MTTAPPSAPAPAPAPAPAAPFLEVRDLVVIRAERPILAVDHLAIQRGETLAVVGPNGAGKSTLLLALARLLYPARGTVAVDGVPLSGRDDLAWRRRIGLVLPAPLLLSASVFDNVASGLRFRGTGRVEILERVDRWLERLSIAHLRDRPARELSTGEAQRASIARALVLEPELLLLDEPFASVDAGTRARLTDDFERLLGELSATCVLVTHDLDEAMRLGDRIAVLLDGRIRQCDVPERLVAAPTDPAVADLLGTETRVRGRVVAARDGLVVVDVGARTDRAPEARGAELLRTLRPDATGRTTGHAPGDDGA